MPEKKDFIAIFKVETEDHLSKLDRGLIELEKQPDNLELLKELNRAAHTIKGSARVFGYNEIQDIAHRIEDIFDKVAGKKLVFNSSVADRIFKAIDVIRAILAMIIKDERIDIDVSEICKELEGCLAEKVDIKDQKILREYPRQAQTKAQGPELQTAVEEYIRVPVSRVNKLLNLVGEVVINKMKSPQRIAQTKRLSKSTKEIQERVSDLSEKIKVTFPFEDGEIAKLFSQCNADLQKLKEETLNLYDSISTEAFSLEPVIDELQSKMKEIRMLPCSTIFEGFPRMVRDISSQQGKEVNLEISGGQTELDKKVLEGIKTPLMHILRNCIDHGIEEPDKREALGKPGYGTIKISAFHKAGNVAIEIEDDGKGMDINEIKQTALKKRLVSSQELEAMTEIEIKNIVFMNGYSTSPIITDVSGRGIGLDVVRRDIENLKGQVALDTEKDKGTKFTLLLPLTIAIIKVLLIKAQGMLFAIPMASIEETIKTNAREISTIEGRMAIQVRGHIVPVVKLNEVLQLLLTETKEEEQKTKEELPVVLTASLDKRVGFIVDEIVSEEEIFIKSLGEHLGKVKNVSGATILGTGEVVVVLDVADIIAQSRLSHPAVLGRKPVPKDKRKEKKILVVEDALSTRELEKSILEAHGYMVDTAVDGLDALDRLAKDKFDLIVADIQMPRMDGFEFCQTLNKNDEYKDIPVVIVTALEKEEDKRRGIEVGAAAYIVKSAFNQMSLLDAIERLIR